MIRRTCRGPLWATLLLVAACLSGAGPAAGPATVGRLTFFLGEVAVRSGTGAWTAARLDQPLTTAHELRTGAESRAELTLGASVVRLGERSRLRLDGVRVEGEAAQGSLSLLAGQLWSRLRGLGGDGLQVRSPTAVMAVRGTTFRAEAAADSSLDLLVYEGRVDAGPAHPSPSARSGGGAGSAGAAGAPGVAAGPRPVAGPFEITLDEWVKVTEGMRLRVRPDGRFALQPMDREADRALDWVRWNQERDSLRHE
jgi:hypothetical protein